MIEYTYMTRGYWHVSCTVCEQSDLSDSIVKAHRFAQDHARRCGT